MSAERPPRPTSEAPERASGEHVRVSGQPPRVERDPEIDLTQSQQQRIDDVFGKLRTLNLYDVLEVPRSADRKAIKRAYSERVNEFHPDRFFRKRLGHYKPKMEAIFTRVSEAHDTLCSPERRADYDGALRASRASVVDEMMAQAESDMEGATEGARREELTLDGPIRVDSSTPPSPRQSMPYALSPAVLPADAQARREALARRLMGARLTPAPFKAPPKK